MDSWLTTSEMSQASGLSVKALRLYHGKGLLVPAKVDAHSSYRYYATDQVDRARVIALLRRLGMPLTRIAEVLDAPGVAARAHVMSWWSDRESQRAEARMALDVVTQRMEPEQDLSGFRALLDRRNVDSRKVATISRTVEQPELVPTFIADVLTLRAELAAAEASFGDEFWVIYHGPVGPGVPGRIETCVPYEGTIDPMGQVSLRQEPAGTLLYVPLRQRECRYPTILQAFHTVMEAAKHVGATGSSREIYPVPWPDNKPNELVAEVAIPVREL